MKAQVDILNSSFDSLDSYNNHQQNNSGSTNNTINSFFFQSKNDQQSESAKRIFEDDINLLFASSSDNYFLGEFLYKNTTIIRSYIKNKEYPHQMIYHTHLKQKYAAYLQNQIIIAHGMYETSAHYMEIAISLVDIGYEVHLFDFCGFGNSGGKRMNVSAKELQSDFITIYEKLSHTRPIYVIACSIAVPIILSCLILNPKTIKIDGFISYSAMISIPRIFNQQSITSGGSFLVLSKLFPQMYLNLKVNYTELHRSNFQIKKDMLLNRNTQAHYISIGMAFDLIKIQNLVLDNLQKVNVPLLILYGQEDSIVNQQDSITLYCKVGNLDKTIKILKDQHHLFLLDSNRQQVLDLIYQWIDIQGKHNVKKEEIINFSHPNPHHVNAQIKQANDNLNQTKQGQGERRRKISSEYNSGILSFCSNKSGSSTPKYDSDDHYDEDEQDDDEQYSDYESVNKMYSSLQTDKIISAKKLVMSDSFHNSTNSCYKEKKENKNNKPNVNNKNNDNSPLRKRKIKRVQESNNICNNCSLSNPNSTNSLIPTYDINAFPYKKNHRQQCIKCHLHPHEKKPKYQYGTAYSAPIKLQTFIKLCLYALAFLILKYLHKKMSILKFLNKDVLLFYSSSLLSKLLKLQKKVWLF